MRTYKNKFKDWEFRTSYITSDKEAAIIVKTLEDKILYGLDIETGKKHLWKDNKQAGLDPHLSFIRLLQIYDGRDQVYVFDMNHVKLSTLDNFLKTNRFVAHNAVFEIMHLTQSGLPNLNIGCSMLMSQMIEGAEHSPYEATLLPTEEEEDDEDQDGLAAYKRTGHSLDALIQRLFGVKVAKTEQMSDWGAKELRPEQIVYAGLDAVLTYKAAIVLAESIKKHKMQKAYTLLKDMQHVVAVMQLEGIPVDWDYHRDLMYGWQQKSDDALELCSPHFGEVNMRSGKQMCKWLLDYVANNYSKIEGDTLLTNWPKTTKGAYAFGKSAISDMKHIPPIAALLNYKKYAKLIDTYGESLIEKKHPITGRLHTSYTLGMTTTGRMSSRSPNVQNFPRDDVFRNMFRAEKGMSLVVSDFSQIELRLQAEFSKDPAMSRVYREGGDVYSTLASNYFGKDISKLPKAEYKEKRMFGKVVMLALGYGMGAGKLETYAANGYGLHKSPEEWQRAHKTYHSTFSVYSAWCKQIRTRAEKLGYIETLLGKRRKLSDNEMYTCAPNTVIQGTAAELMMKAMLICQKKVGSYAKLVATVHDEILIHVEQQFALQAQKDLADSMNEAMRVMFPRAVSHEVAEAAIGNRWGEAKGGL